MLTSPIFFPGVQGIALSDLAKRVIQCWTGEVQYTALGSAGDTCVMSAVFTFTEAMIDIGFDSPQKRGIGVMSEVYYSPNWVTGFHIYDK